jgi:hypothetical protein
MAFNTKGFLTDVLAAGAGAFGERWPGIEKFVRVEMSTLATRVAEIEAARLARQIDAETARLLLRMQLNLLVAAIAGVSNLTMLAVEAAINAMLRVAQGALEAAIGVALPF